MSRTIKYRVWDNENKSYNDPYSYAYYAMAQDGGLDFYCHGDHMCEADPDVYFIEQYTGLTDKNGKEIYEGDILWWEHFYGMTGENIETTAEVYWEEKDASFVVGDWFEPLGHLVDEDEVEVIGNIHESNMEELCPKE